MNLHIPFIDEFVNLAKPTNRCWLLLPVNSIIFSRVTLKPKNNLLNVFGFKIENPKAIDMKDAKFTSGERKSLSAFRSFLNAG
jgi:hypothetical protein